jgi:hypothetical protein
MQEPGKTAWKTSKGIQGQDCRVGLWIMFPRDFFEFWETPGGPQGHDNPYRPWLETRSIGTNNLWNNLEKTPQDWVSIFHSSLDIPISKNVKPVNILLAHSQIMMRRCIRNEGSKPMRAKVYCLPFSIQVCLQGGRTIQHDIEQRCSFLYYFVQRLSKLLDLDNTGTSMWQQ